MYLILSVGVRVFYIIAFLGKENNYIYVGSFKYIAVLSLSIDCFVSYCDG